MKHRRFLSILLVLVMVFSMIPAFTRTANAAGVIKETVEEDSTAALTEAEISAEPVYEETSAEDASAESEKAALSAAEIKAEPAFTEVSASSASLLEIYLEADGNYKIYIQDDIEFQIGKAGDTVGHMVDYWIELGSGIKVIYLQGHLISYSCDRFGDGSTSISDGGSYYHLDYKQTGTLFKIGSGSELVINDPDNKGKITYKCTLRERDWELGGDIGRNIFHVLRGGKLTINGGRIIAGRYSRNWIETRVKYLCLQTNGIAVLIDGGDVIINGGIIEGRGYLMTDLDNYRRAAAVRINSGSLKMYDGEIAGAGNAEPYQRASGSDVTMEIYGGALDSHDLGDNIMFNTHEIGPDKAEVKVVHSILADPQLFYTEVYIPDTNSYVSSTGIGNGWACGDGRKEIFPIEKKNGFACVYDGTEKDFINLDYGDVIEWDKTTSLRFRLNHHEFYPHDLRSFDVIKNRSYNNLIAWLCTSPDGESIAPVLDHREGTDWVDLNDLPQSTKDMLKVGNAYYLRLQDTETWNENTITYKDVEKVLIKIVEPEMTKPNLNLSMQFKNTLTSNGSNQITLIPAGDGSRENMDALYYSGKISEYKTTFSYYDMSGTWNNKSFDNQTGNSAFINFYRGLSSARYSVEFFKNGKSLGSVSTTQQVVCFPDITANKTMDEFNCIFLDVDASDKTVVLSCKNANSTSGIFWAKDGVKVSGSANKATWTVDASSGSNVGWWSLGYTVDGKD